MWRLEAAAAVLSRGVDALWVSPDITVITAVDVMIATAKQARVPLFTSIPGNARKGALAHRQPLHVSHLLSPSGGARCCGRVWPSSSCHSPPPRKRGKSDSYPLRRSLFNRLELFMGCDASCVRCGSALSRPAR